MKQTNTKNEFAENLLELESAFGMKHIASLNEHENKNEKLWSWKKQKTRKKNIKIT